MTGYTNDESVSPVAVSVVDGRRSLAPSQAKQRASILWLLSKACDSVIPDDLREPYYKDHDGEDRLKPHIVQALATAELYCMALSNIYADPNYNHLNHTGVIAVLTRKGIYVQDPQDMTLTESILIRTNPIKMSAHMVIIDALMSLYIKEVLIPEKVIEVVNRFAPIDPELEELPEEAEDAALYWMNKSCQKFCERIGEEVASLTPTSDPDKQDRSRVPTLTPLEYVWDLSDGCALAALLSFYCPSSLHWKEICFNEPMSMADILYNLQMVEAFCVTHLPSDIFFLPVQDLYDCHRVVRQNVLAFVADLLYHFEIKPAECVLTPIADYNPLLSDEEIVFNGRSHHHQDHKYHRQHHMPTPAEMKAMSLQHIAWDSDESARLSNGRRNSLTTSTKKLTPMRSASHSYRRSISQEQQLDQFYADENDEEMTRYFDAVLDFDPRSTSSPESLRTPRRNSLQGKRLFANNDVVDNGLTHHHHHHQSTPYSQLQQPVPMRCSPAAAAGLDSRHNSSPGVGFEIRQDLAESSSMSEISIARKKEAIMMQSIRRRAEQEERKRKQQEEQARKRDEERKRVEEAERKREEERMKKQKILEEHRLQKAGSSGIWEPNTPSAAETSVRQKSKWNIPSQPVRQSVSPAASRANSYRRSTSRDDHTASFSNGRTNGEDTSRYFSAFEISTGLESSPESILIPKDTKPLPQGHQTPLPQNDHLKLEQNGDAVVQPQVPTNATPATPVAAASGGGDDVSQRPSTPGVGFVISADVVDHSSVSELTMAKKKEMIMQQSIKRKEEQEARRKLQQEEQARKREEDRKRTEEAERKREEERMRKQKILEEYRLKKAAEDEEKIGGGTSFVIPAGARDLKNNTVLLRRGNRPVRPATGTTVKSRPKSLHVNSSLMNDYLSLDPKVSKVTDSIDSSSCHFDSQPNNNHLHHNHHQNSSTLSQASIRTGNSEHSLISSHENSSSSCHVSPFTRTAVPISSTGSSRPPSALSTSSRMLSSPPSTSQFSVMPTMPPVFQRNRGPPSDCASDVGSTFSEYTGPKLFVKPTQKTNRGIVLNAIGIVLAGSVNADVKKKVIEEIGKSDSKHFLILFRGAGLQFRGIYSYSPDHEEVLKLHGAGPKCVTNDMIDKFYKYNSGSKNFVTVHTKHLSITIDAFTIHNNLWPSGRSAAGAAAAIPARRPVSMIVTSK